MSPGDVESISEGDIPEAEGGLSPSQGAEEGPEPFEPILSDEEIADDGDHQVSHHFTKLILSDDSCSLRITRTQTAV